jgi:luciferase-like monooxygenase
MEFGVHLPLVAFRGQVFSLSHLVDYAETAEQLGFTALCANDHLTFSRPWLDSITALTTILTKTRQMTLITTVVLPVARGPVPLAKSLAALDVLSGGHLIAGVGPGSLPQDYALVGIAFEGRWKRFDEAIQLLRRLLQRDVPPFTSQFYAPPATPLEPFPAQELGMPIWIGSWGSEAGLRLIAWIHATLGAVAVIPGNPRRQKNRSCLPPTWTKEELGKRSAIERFFGRVFLFFHLQRPPFCGWSASLIVALAAQHAGRPDLIRSPKRVLAHTWEGFAS